MSEYNAKNYTEQGGDVTHIGGKLVIEDGATVEGLPEGGSYELPIASASELGGVKIGAGLSISEAGVLSANGGGGAAIPVKTIQVTGTTSALNVNVTFPEGFNRSELETYADGPREYILQVHYGPSSNPRMLQFEGFDGTYAVFTLLEYAYSTEPVFDLTVVYIAYLDNEACRDKVYYKRIPIAG